MGAKAEHFWSDYLLGLGELLGHDYGNTSLTRLYTVSDKLLKHQATLESFLADRRADFVQSKAQDCFV